MERLCLRFPHLSKSILNNLDNQNLMKSKEASKEIFHFLENERFYWIRMIGRKYWNFEGFEESWKEAIHQTPFDLINELANEVQSLFTSHNLCSISIRPIHPLHVAALQGNLKLYKYIVAKTKDKMPQGRLFEKYTDDGNMFAIPTIGDPSIYEPIIGATPLHMAAMNGNLEVCKYISENSDNKYQVGDGNLNETPLNIAAANGHLQVVKILIESFVEKDQRNGGWTPLHHAAGSNASMDQLEVCRFIIEKIDIKNPANNNGLTPLHIAAEMGHFDLCKLIIANVSNKHPLDNNGQTPRDRVDQCNQSKTRSIMLALFDS